jgi:2-hydroxychromene-2-carboxylate isomerase
MAAHAAGVVPLVTGRAALRERLTRATVPRLVLRAAAASRAAHERVARLRGAFGSRPEIELYLAFDDPYGVIAVQGAAELAARHGAKLTLYPVVDHGIAGDPDLPLRRAYALRDAHRLLARTGKSLARTAPLEPDAARFLAAWTEAARSSGKAVAFALAAATELWLSSDGAVDVGRYRGIYERTVGQRPPEPSASLDALLAHNAARLRSRGHWETPSARIAGEWFFAHERLEQMSELLARLDG